MLRKRIHGRRTMPAPFRIGPATPELNANAYSIATLLRQLKRQQNFAGIAHSRENEIQLLVPALNGCRFSFYSVQSVDLYGVNAFSSLDFPKTLSSHACLTVESAENLLRHALVQCFVLTCDEFHVSFPATSPIYPRNSHATLNDFVGSKASWSELLFCLSA